MSFDGLLVHTVTVLTPGTTTDAYGDTVPNWTTATSVSSAARVVQRSARENIDTRDASITEWVVYLPGDVTVTHANRIVWDGLTFEVAGDPKPAVRRTSTVHHYEVPLNRIAG